MNKNKSLISALFVMLLWGSLFPMIKLGYAAHSIETVGDILLFAGVRFTICGSLVSLYAFITDKASFKPIKSALVPVLLSGLFSIILHYSFTYCALQLTDSSKTAILKQIGALLYVCFSFLFFKDDRLTAKKLIGAVMGFSGIIAINSNAKGVSFNLGDALIIAASFCLVVSNIISKKVFAKVTPITATGVSQFFGGIVLLIIGVFMHGSMSFDFNTSYVFIYICLASIFSYCIWFNILKTGELSKLFIIKFAEPVFACIFGAIILRENIFNIQYLLSFLLIAGGIYISNK